MAYNESFHESGYQHMMVRGSGVAPAAALYIVATPIGNLGDMVPRAVEILQSVDRVVAEDTRHSRKLLQHFNIQTPLQSFHDHSGRRDVEMVIQRLLAGESIALISDAGTPLISDPGYPLVALAHERGIPVVSIPGPCAAIVALAASGLPTDHFWFEGFLPVKQVGRRQRLAQLASLQATLVFYEAPHRIVELFTDLLEVLGSGRHCCMARELTKQFETIRSGSILEIKAFIERDTNQQRGEFVILVAPEKRETTTALDEEAGRVLEILLEELSVKQAASLAAKITGKPRRILYEAALEKKADN